MISPNKANFDGTNLLITLAPGETAIDVQVDLYSAWKDWAKQGDNLKYHQAFRTIGGDPLGGNLKAGAYFFLQNDVVGVSPSIGWRIRPTEQDHEVVMTGNLFGEDTTVPILVPTLGAFTVTVRLNTSSLTQQVTTTQQVPALTAAESAQLTLMEQILRNATVTDPATGRMTVYTDDGGSPLLEADIFNDAAGATQYDGTGGIERRNKLVSP